MGGCGTECQRVAQQCADLHATCKELLGAPEDCVHPPKECMPELLFPTVMCSFLGPMMVGLVLYYACDMYNADVDERILKGPGARRAVATIRTVALKSKIKSQGNSMQREYSQHATYAFDAEKTDGTSCRIEVYDMTFGVGGRHKMPRELVAGDIPREGRELVWLSARELWPVLYDPKDPRRHQLELYVGDGESSRLGDFEIMAWAFAILWTVVGIILGILLPLYIRSSSVFGHVVPPRYEWLQLPVVLTVLTVPLAAIYCRFSEFPVGITLGILLPPRGHPPRGHPPRGHSPRGYPPQAEWYFPQAARDALGGAASQSACPTQAPAVTSRPELSKRAREAVAKTRGGAVAAGSSVAVGAAAAFAAPAVTPAARPSVGVSVVSVTATVSSGLTSGHTAFVRGLPLL